MAANLDEPKPGMMTFKEMTFIAERLLVEELVSNEVLEQSSRWIGHPENLTLSVEARPMFNAISFRLAEKLLTFRGRVIELPSSPWQHFKQDYLRRLPWIGRRIKVETIRYQAKAYYTPTFEIKSKNVGLRFCDWEQLRDDE